MFDPKSYCGAVDETKLINDVKRSLVGVNFLFNDKYENRLYRVVRLVCSFSTTLYKDKCFVKVGTKPGPLKVCGHASFGCLDDSKTKEARKPPVLTPNQRQKYCI